MASSGDDDSLPQIVTDYWFVDEKEIPISFTAVPFHLDGACGRSAATKRRIFLRGSVDSGLQKVYKQVTSWRLRLREDHPEVLVLLSGGKWLTLRKPRKSYKERFRSIMITIKWLHCLKRTPDFPEKELWDRLQKVFSSFEVRPSKNDLTEHVSLIKTIAERDKTLAKSKVLVMFLKHELGKRPDFFGAGESGSVAEKSIVAYDNMVDEGTKGADGDQSMEELGLFDSVCAFCDDGGDILCCEGRCLRSFHATKDAGAHTNCESLGYTMAQVKAIPDFLCKNCRYKQHQCFACGKLGSSDKTAGAEVFRCASATCGHFYHPKCVAELLFQANELEALKFQKMVAAGESFTCSIHKCAVCHKRENNEIPELQFAICRRCPTSYHRKCLPRKIVFNDLGQGVYQRAWVGLLRDRILIYCMKHKIDDILRTPIRNHIIFPEDPEKRNKIKITIKKRISDDSPMEQPSVKFCKLNRKHSNTVESSSVASQRTDSQLKESTGSKCCKTPLKDKSKYSMPPVSPNPIEKKFCSSFPVADSETIKRLKTLMDDVSSSLTLEDIRKKHMIPSTHAYSARHTIKSVTLGKVEGSVEAIRTAVQKLEAGFSIDEAKMICEPRILNQVLRWRQNFNVYLAPFLHGMRYTSFGRHFTKVDKLNEIVDKLQWYVQSGDMIVDFCCGANDFSTLMKEKLDAAGKRCSFKNYDIIQPKNDFNFERKDWMKVEPQELADGSRLIMGLNPPFGIRGGLANMFIDKALTFRPKLLILIVPKKTQRLEKKDPPYDLIWEDCEKLSGKSFYLPGSIDIDEKQMDQWNLKSPPLYLWSRCDWTARHKNIALEKGHIFGTPRYNTSDHEHPPIEPNSCYRDEEKVATSGAVELGRSVNRRGVEENLEALEEGELESSDMNISPEVEGSLEAFEGELELSDMNISSADTIGHESTFGADQNLKVLEVREETNESTDTKNAPADTSGHNSTFENFLMDESEFSTIYGHADFSTALPPGESGFTDNVPLGFAPGPLPEFFLQGSSCGWVDD